MLHESYVARSTRTLLREALYPSCIILAISALPFGADILSRRRRSPVAAISVLRLVGPLNVVGFIATSLRREGVGHYEADGPANCKGGGTNAWEAGANNLRWPVDQPRAEVNKGWHIGIQPFVRACKEERRE